MTAGEVTLFECAYCEDKRQVPTTPGQPGDGPMPCPECGESECGLEIDGCRCARAAGHPGLHRCPHGEWM